MYNSIIWLWYSRDNWVDSLIAWEVYSLCGFIGNSRNYEGSVEENKKKDFLFQIL